MSEKTQCEAFVPDRQYYINYWRCSKTATKTRDGHRVCGVHARAQHVEFENKSWNAR